MAEEGADSPANVYIMENSPEHVLLRAGTARLHHILTTAFAAVGALLPLP
jgi:multidrug efflux pump subunit AcrB